MLNLPHPDALQAQQAAKGITRGGRQAADSAAMEAYFDAIEAGKTIDEAGAIFIRTYQKVIQAAKAPHK
jgi:hypothetical protein